MHSARGQSPRVVFAAGELRWVVCKRLASPDRPQSMAVERQTAPPRCPAISSGRLDVPSALRRAQMEGLEK